MGWRKEGLLKKVWLELRPEGLWKSVKANMGGGWSRESVLRWRVQAAQVQETKAHVARLGSGSS